jgi:hypothetical protein
MELPMTDIGKLLEAHTRKVMVGAVQIAKKLEEHGITFVELDNWLKENPQLGADKRRRSSQKGKEKFGQWKPIRKCPKCGCHLVLISLTDKEKERETGMQSKWRCAGKCSKKPCDYVEYNKQTVEEILKDFEVAP